MGNHWFHTGCVTWRTKKNQHYNNRIGEGRAMDCGGALPQNWREILEKEVEDIGKKYRKLLDLRLEEVSVTVGNHWFHTGCVYTD